MEADNRKLLITPKEYIEEVKVLVQVRSEDRMDMQAVPAAVVPEEEQVQEPVVEDLSLLSSLSLCFLVEAAASVHFLEAVVQMTEPVVQEQVQVL